MEKDKCKPALHIGMRNLKTGLAVLICLLIYHVAGRDGGFLAAISAIICMQDSVEKSLTSGIHRLYGTVIGAVLGMAFLYMNQHFNNAYLVMVMIPLGVMMLILLCNLLNRSNSIVIGCMVFLMIVLEQNDQPPFIYSVNRLLDTLIGILVAIVVNRFVLNPDTRKKRQQPVTAEAIAAKSGVPESGVPESGAPEDEQTNTFEKAAD